jgi:hypothetical protein
VRDFFITMRWLKKIFIRKTHSDLSMLCSGIFENENYEDFTLRYDGFGKEIYSIIKSDLPNIFKHLRFYRLVHPQHNEGHSKFDPDDDSFALFDNGKKTFVILLDYYGVICIWNKSDINWETGLWSVDPIQDIINITKQMEL